MKYPTPKQIGFEIELAAYGVRCEEHTSPSRHGLALVDAHHTLNGTSHLIAAELNEFDKNGWRAYLDHEKPEFSSPMCLSARDLVLCLRAAREFVRCARCEAEKASGPLL